MLLERFKYRARSHLKQDLKDMAEKLTLLVIKDEGKPISVQIKRLEAQIGVLTSRAYSRAKSNVQKDLDELYGLFEKVMPDSKLKPIQIDTPVLVGEAGLTIADQMDRTRDIHKNRLKDELISATLLKTSSSYKSRVIKRTNLETLTKEGDALLETSGAMALGDAVEQYDSEHDEVIGYQSIAVLDNKTTKRCASLHGKIWYKSQGYTVAKLKSLNYWFPRHFRCRSVVYPLTSDSKPMTQNFKQFFDKQSDEFKKEFLGDSRFNLYKTGKLEVNEFLDVKNGKLFSLQKLKDMI